MFKFRAKSPRNGGTTALEDRPPQTQDATVSSEVNPSLGDGELHSQLERLSEENRFTPSPAREREVLRLRNLLGVRRLETASGTPSHPEPEFERLPEEQGLPKFDADQVTPGVLRAGILRHGCLFVRGLIPRDEALQFAEQIDRSFAERDRHDEGQAHDDGLYSEFTPDPSYGAEVGRPWIKMGGGVLAVDSPTLSFRLREMLRAARFPELAHGYLSEEPLITVQKTTLRKADPSVPGAWHQDGKFMGPVRALNLWLSLSRCGDESPGLDIVPRRLDYYVKTQTDEALLDYTPSQRVVEEAAGDAGIIRPIFEPGDALLFDDLFMHKTGSDPAMPKPRYAVESWFFGATGFPTEYAPLTI